MNTARDALSVQASVGYMPQRFGLEGAATFIRLPLLATELERVPGNVELHVDFEHLDYIDHACLDLLINWDKQHEATGGTLVIDWDTLHANFHQENSSRAAIAK